jgi:hypothetical protein
MDRHFFFFWNNFFLILFTYLLFEGRQFLKATNFTPRMAEHGEQDKGK